MVRFVGCCHPKVRDPSYVGPQLTERRMAFAQQMLSKRPGTPIMDTHKGVVLGQVHQFWVDGEQQLWLRAEVDESTALGLELAKKIRSGEYRGLSLGMDHSVVRRDRRTRSTKASAGDVDDDDDIDGGPEWDGVSEVLWSSITEVSVCPRGKYPNTVLHSHFSQDPGSGSGSRLLFDFGPSSSSGSGSGSGSGSSGGTASGEKMGRRTDKSAGLSGRSGTETGADTFSEKLQSIFSLVPTHIDTNTTTTPATMSTPATTTDTGTGVPAALAPKTTATVPGSESPQAVVPPVVVPTKTEKPADGADAKQAEVPAGAGDATTKDSEAHQLSVARLEVEKMQAEMKEMKANMQREIREKKAFQGELAQFTHATRELLQTDDAAKLTELANKRRTEVVTEAYEKAKGLLPTLQEWVGDADPAARTNLTDMTNTVQSFVTADPAVLKDPARLKIAIATTEVLHTIKHSHDKKMVAQHKKMAEVESRVAALTAQVEAGDKRLAGVQADYNMSKRRLDLMAEATGSTLPSSGAPSTAAGVPEAMAAGTGHQPSPFGFAGYEAVTNGGRLQTVASANNAATSSQNADATLAALFGVSNGQSGAPVPTPAPVVNNNKRARPADIPSAAAGAAGTPALLKTAASASAPARPVKRMRSDMAMHPDLIGAVTQNRNVISQTPAGRVWSSLLSGISEEYKAGGSTSRSYCDGVEHMTFA